MARQLDPKFPEIGETGAMNFREELHAIEAVLAGQGISILSDVVVARELAAGQLVKALDFPIPGLGFYLVHVPGHPRQSHDRSIPLMDDLRGAAQKGRLSWEKKVKLP